jgi:hypothetical protein
LKIRRHEGWDTRTGYCRSRAEFQYLKTASSAENVLAVFRFMKSYYLVAVFAAPGSIINLVAGFEVHGNVIRVLRGKKIT